MRLPTQCVIRWPMVYLQGYRSLSPERMQGNGSENWVHQAEHLLAKCKQTEMGSSPITGAAASKNNPVAQQLRNPVWAVTSAAEQLWQERQSILPRHARISSKKVQLGIEHVGKLFTILLCEQAGMYCCRSAGGSEWVPWATNITSSLCRPFIKTSSSCINSSLDK